jgi:mono/diheme cytochrome c family protein
VIRAPLIVIGAAALAMAGGGGGRLASGATAAADSALTPFARAKAEALLADRLSCLACHSLRGQGGRLAPELSDVGRRRSAAYIGAIVADPQRTVPGTIMPRQAMPEGMRELIVRYLSAGASPAAGPAAGGGPPPKSESNARPAPDRHPSDAARTQPTLTPAAPPDTPAPALYGRFCAPCHGTTGAGDGPNARFLPVPPARHASSADMALRSDDRLFDGIAAGGWVLDKSPRMPPFGETLTRDQIQRLVAHIRTLCRCSGPAWSAKSNATAPAR